MGRVTTERASDSKIASPTSSGAIPSPSHGDTISEGDVHTERLASDPLHTERYLLVATVVDPRSANLACATLESNGIPTMVEHLRVLTSSTVGTAFRILTPLSCVQNALGILTRLGLTQSDTEAEGDTATDAAV